MLTSSSRILVQRCNTLRTLRPLHRCVTLPARQYPHHAYASVNSISPENSRISSNSISHATDKPTHYSSMDKSEDSKRIDDLDIEKNAVELIVSNDKVNDLVKMTDEELRSRVDDFQNLFVEARLCIEDCNDSVGTTYFDEEVVTAREAVDLACKAYAEILGDLVREEKDKNIIQSNTSTTTRSNEIRRSNGLKVEQLKGELQLVLDSDH